MEKQAEKKPLTKKQLRCLRDFGKTSQTDVKSPKGQDIEAFFELDELGFLDTYFNGCIDDLVGYITDAGKAALSEATPDD